MENWTKMYRKILLHLWIWISIDIIWLLTIVAIDAKNITKDAKKQTGIAKQTWEYFNIINDIINDEIGNSAIAPLSIASNIRDFTINENVLHLSDEKQCENEQNVLNLTSTNILKKGKQEKENQKHLLGWKN